MGVVPADGGLKKVYWRCREAPGSDRVDVDAWDRGRRRRGKIEGVNGTKPGRGGRKGCGGWRNVSGGLEVS